VQIELLAAWQDHEGIDFWSGLRLDEESQVMASPETQEIFEKILIESGIEFSTEIADLEEKFVEERRLNNGPRSARVNESSFNHFWELDEIYDYIDDLATRFPNIVRVHSVDRTFEDRIIKWITISLDGSAGNNPVMVLDSGIHAREWISQMTVMYLIYQLVERPENIELLRNVDWVIIPVVNPDGYVYSYETDRLWRKNRTPQSNGCIGVDLNRNFDLEWRASSNVV
jgi:murein tripeptide amidase MpaA